MSLLIVLLACSTPRWTEEGALAPHRAAIDTNGDGRVTADEYDRVRWQGPPFSSADGDGDGDLSAAELLTLFRAQSATRFDGAPPEEDARPGTTAGELPPALQDAREAEEGGAAEGSQVESAQTNELLTRSKLALAKECISAACDDARDLREPIDHVSGRHLQCL